MVGDSDAAGVEVEVRHADSGDAAALSAEVVPQATVFNGYDLPDFSRAGLIEPLPVDSVVVRVEQHGAIADDAQDDTAAIEAALAALPAEGGVVEFGPGTYLLTRPQRIISDNVHLRGAGREATRITFTHSREPQSVEFFRPLPGTTLRPGDVIEVHSNPSRMRKHQIFVNGTLLFERGPAGEGERFSLVVPASKIPSSTPAGKVLLSAVVERLDGTRTEERLEIDYDPTPLPPGSERITHSVGVFMFLGDDSSSPDILLAQTAARGDSRIDLARDDHAIIPGDLIRIEQRATDEWLEFTQSTRKDFHKRYVAHVAEVAGATIILDQPLRLDFGNGSTVRKMYPIRNGSVADLTIEQTEKRWIDTLLFEAAFNCLVRGVGIESPGRNPIVLSSSKHCEIRDSVFRKKPWFSGGGGTGYLGFSGTFDSLIDNIDAEDLRHAPAVQAWSSGNVLRQSKFVRSDINFHMLWAHENLIEQCELDAERGTGSYGYAVFAQKPEMAIHGPGGGPRNVIYNNHFTSPRSGVWLGGSNDNWLIAYNRFDMEAGPGMLFRSRSTNHLVLGNTLRIGDNTPAFMIEDTASTGIRCIDNQAAGADTLFSGEGTPALNENNQLVATESLIAPTPPIPSIFKSQKSLKK